MICITPFRVATSLITLLTTISLQVAAGEQTLNQRTQVQKCEENLGFHEKISNFFAGVEKPSCDPSIAELYEEIVSGSNYFGSNELDIEFRQTLKSNNQHQDYLHTGPSMSKIERSSRTTESLPTLPGYSLLKK